MLLGEEYLASSVITVQSPKAPYPPVQGAQLPGFKTPWICFL
jgi:hypothetical protein